jgi:flagellar hook-associated protein 2
MGTITSNVGLISGINTGAIIDGLISIDSQPINLLQTQIKSAQNQQTAYKAIETQLTSIQQIGQSLALPQTFQAATTTSSNQNVLTATAGVAAAVGSYQFQVARLVSTQQTISNGFANTGAAPVGAGTITLEEGGGEAFSQTALSQLNGGAGVTRGQFRITDRSGKTTVIDTSNDITLDDVVTQINNALGVSVRAAVTNQGLQLTDQSGGSGTFSIQDLNGGTSAQNLGISGNATGNTLNGSNINFITAATSLGQLNDGNGIGTAANGNQDFTVTTSDGSTFNITLAGATTVGDVLTDINNVGGTKLKASISSGGTGIQLTDNSGGGGSFTIAPLNGSTAASDLGLTTPATGSNINGAPLIAGLDSVLIRSLNGGSGIPLGTISITDRANHSGNINLSGATSLSDIIKDINQNTSGIKVSASMNTAGTGIQLTDTSGGAGNLVIADTSGGTTAASLGIAGTFGTSTQTVTGSNLQRKFISANTLLSDFGGGHGVSLGQFNIQNSTGGTAMIDLTQGNITTVGDVINAINSKSIGVQASINATGNGILLTDTAGGTGKMTVTEANGGSTASDLNITGTASGTTIDGALQKTITVSSTDTLASIQSKINALSFGVTANIINDGSSTAPNRISLTAINSGAAGRVIIDSGTTNLGLRNLVSGQDAAVFYGGSGGTQPLLITSNTNQLTNVIKGVTVNLVSASTSPVNLTVSPDSTAVSGQLQNFVADFNSLVTTITADTAYDTTNNVGGILLGDGTTQQVQEAIYNMVNRVVVGAGKFKDLAQVGITVNATGDVSQGTMLNFDPNAFATAFASDPNSVQDLFSAASIGLGNVINNAMTALTDPVNGSITLEDKTLTTQIQGYNDHINELNAILAEKKLQLETEFNSMESSLATLQSQGTLLSALSSLKISTPSTSNVGSGASSSSSKTGG